MTKTYSDLIYLVTCAVNDRIPDPGRIKNMDSVSLYGAAQRHMLVSVAAFALRSAGIKDEHFEKANLLAALRTSVMDMEMEAVLDEMEKKAIFYMPLKGIVIRNSYPDPAMREMADHDIFFDEDHAEEVKNIMLSHGFCAKNYGEGHEDVYYKEPFCNFEMHRRLFDKALYHETDLLYEYYEDVKSRFIKDEGKNYACHFSPEDFYIYMISHEYKHYIGGGTGLRSLLDTYVYLKNNNLDLNYIAEETDKLGITDFEMKNRSLSGKLFDGVELTESDSEMLDYMISSGTFGNMKNSVDNQIRLRGGRFKYFISRLTLPYPEMVRNYPALKKLPLLYPFFWTYRLIHGLIFKRQKLIYQLKASLGIRNK